MGTPDGLEASIVPQAGLSFQTIKVRSFKRSFSLSLILTLGALLSAFLRSLKIIRDFRPSVVVGLGGYVSVPGVLAAFLMRIPTVIHEQNAVPGLANRVLARFANVVGLTYPGSEVFFPSKKKIRTTGNPVRKEVRGVVREDSIKILGLDPSKMTLLVFGGSRGAKRINDAAVAAYQLFRDRKDLQVLHITGKFHYENVASAIESVRKEEDKLIYRIYPYVDNIAAFYAVADLALCRAGATTIAELMACSVPAVLVPYPFAADAHQEKNAQFAEEKGAAIVVFDKDLTSDLVYQKVHGIIDSKENLERMKRAAESLGNPEAGRVLAEIVLKAGRRT